jgi:hypothetical protein
MNKIKIFLRAITLFFITQNIIHAENNDDTVTINLEISDGQNGTPLPESEEESPGAFTVANKNDTDGDGIPDSQDNEVQGEIDLMQLVMHPPTNADPEEECTLTLPGNAKLFKTPNKVGGEEAQRKWKVKDLPQTRWVELLNASSKVRSEEIKWSGLGKIDTVKATGIWVNKRKVAQNTATARDVLAADRTWTDMPNPPAGQFVSQDGVGLIAISAEHGVRNALMIQFEVFPDDVGKEGKVKFDPSRQANGKAWFDNLAPVVKTKPAIDEANDDPGNGDESLIPTENNYLYTRDSPGINTISAGTNTKFTFYSNFYEFVRVRVDGVVPAGNKTDGSRCSDKILWHVRHNLIAEGGLWSRDADKPNDVAETHIVLP